MVFVRNVFGEGQIIGLILVGSCCSRELAPGWVRLS